MILQKKALTDPSTTTNLRFGLNYTPSRNWYYCWNDWDLQSIRDDLQAIAGIGADHIRFMLIWPSFQPNSGWVSEAHLDRMDALIHEAGRYGLDVCPTLVNGWLTGDRFVPPYDPERRADFYTDTTIRDAIEVYFRAVASRLSFHSNILAVDLGNEIGCCWETKETTDAGDNWSLWCRDLLQRLLPGRRIVHGVDHSHWFRPITFSPEMLANFSDVITLHTWTKFTGALELGGPLDGPAVELPVWMARRASTFANDPERPVWIQEYGASEDWMPSATVAPYLEKTTRHAIEAGGISWFTWWASHDINRKFKFGELEYSLGLLDINNRPKPAAAVFARIAREYGGKPVGEPAFSKSEAHAMLDTLLPSNAPQPRGLAAT